MNKAIAVEFLLAQEFAVECWIRTIKGTIIEQMTKLSECIQNEFLKGSPPPTIAHNNARKNPKQEVKICTGKLADLKQKLTNLMEQDADISVDALDCIRSRLKHVQGRLERISYSSCVKSRTAKLLKACNDFQTNINVLLENNAENSKNPSLAQIAQIEIEEDESLSEVDPTESQAGPSSSNNRGSQNLEDLPPPTLLSDHSNIEQLSSKSKHDEHLSKVIADLKREISNLKNLSNPSNKAPLKPYPKLRTNKNPNYDRNLNFLSTYSRSSRDTSERNSSSESETSDFFSTKLTFGKLNCQFYFDGSSSCLPVDDFIYRVERLGKVHRISNSQLVDEVSFLLRDTAATWYWRYLKKTKCRSWSQLKQDFIAYFDDRGDENIIRYVEYRKQRTWESYSEYYKDIRSKILLLSKDYEEKDLMRILYKNMRHGLSCLLISRNFKTVRELVSECTRLEEHWNKHNFVPEMLCQTKRSVNELETFDLEESDHRYTSKEVDALYNSKAKADNPKNLVCWNCMGDHWYRDCPEPIKPLCCFGCGQHVPLKPYCKAYVPGNDQGMTGKTGGPVNPKLMQNPSCQDTEQSQINRTFRKF